MATPIGSSRKKLIYNVAHNQWLQFVLCRFYLNQTENDGANCVMRHHYDWLLLFLFLLTATASCVRLLQLIAVGETRCDICDIQMQVASNVSYLTAALHKETNCSVCLVCVLPSCVPQQTGLFTEGLLCSLTKKMLIQHIPSMFTYRKKRVGRESCV